MAPLKPHWNQPSHGDIQEVIINEHEFTSKSLSKVTLPPFGLYAKMAFPPCTLAQVPIYATVQIARNKHLNLNSDLLYINHSCEPSLIFDTANLNIIAGPRGLKPGDELTFFYPSTEWHMAQPFDCLCGTPTCRGRIAGAKNMGKEQLEGLWINGHIHELLEEQNHAKALTVNGKPSENGNVSATETEDAIASALKDALKHAENVVEAARSALSSYLESSRASHKAPLNGKTGVSGAGLVTIATRRGPTSRELSGEMGGDTIAV